MSPVDTPPGAAPTSANARFDGLSAAILLAEHKWLVLLGPIAIGAMALGIAFTLPPIFTARTSLVAPQPPQSTAQSALAALGPGAGALGATLKSPADQYVALMQSVTLRDRIIAKFSLQRVYEKTYLSETRHQLDKNVRITAGKKDGMITVEVDDTDARRAADIANAHVDELRRLTSVLALTEAQQRRVFFERQLQETKGRLADAQVALQRSGISQSALKSEPMAAADAYAQVKAAVTAAEVRLQTMHGYLAEGAIEMKQAEGELLALRQQLAKLEGGSDTKGDPDYVGKFREFKYQETLFDLYARQFELARADESREGALIQVVDPALPPDRKSRPSRAVIALCAAVLSGLAIVGWLFLVNWWRRLENSDAATRAKIIQFRRALRGR